MIITKYDTKNYRKLFLSPYVETYFDIKKQTACFIQYLFGEKISLLVEHSTYTKMIDLLTQGVDETRFKEFLSSNNLPEELLIENLLGRCIIE